MPLPMHSSRPKGGVDQIKHIIAVAAGKGGVGKSSVAVHLALVLKKLGYKVGVMDVDLYGPSVRKMLPEDQPPSQEGSMIIPAVCQGIKMISMAYFKKDHEAAAVRAPIANQLIQHFIQNVMWEELDFLIVDFPPGTGDIQLTVCQQIHFKSAIMVTTPQEVATLDVRKAIHLFDQLQIPVMGIIENMSYYLDPRLPEPIYMFGEGGGQRLANEHNLCLLGQIPLDPLFCELSDKGLSYFDQDPEMLKPLAQTFLKLAEHVIVFTETTVATENVKKQFEFIWKEMK